MPGQTSDWKASKMKEQIYVSFNRKWNNKTYKPSSLPTSNPPTIPSSDPSMPSTTLPALVVAWTPISSLYPPTQVPILHVVDDCYQMISQWNRYFAGGFVGGIVERWLLDGWWTRWLKQHHVVNWLWLGYGGSTWWIEKSLKRRVNCRFQVAVMVDDAGCCCCCYSFGLGFFSLYVLLLLQERYSIVFA